MTPFAESVMQKCIHIGRFYFDETSMKFESVLTNAQLKDLGDLVYFFIYDAIMKVGMTTNMATRKGTYCQIKKSCQTTIMIHAKALEEGIPYVDVYAQQVPRLQKTITSLISGMTYDIEVSQAREYEKTYTREAMQYGDSLIFSSQK